MMGLDPKMGFSDGLVMMMMMIKGLDDDGKIGYWLNYEIDYVHRFDEDNDEKDFFFWVDVLFMMKIMKKRMEGEGRRWIIQTLTFFWIYLTEETKTGNGDKDKVLKRSFF